MLKENYEFEVLENEPIWKVTVYGMSDATTSWKSETLIIEMIDYCLMRINQHASNLFRWHWNGEILSKARVYFYFDDENAAKMVSEKLEYSMVDVDNGSLPNTIEQVKSINERKLMKKTKHITSIPALQKMIKNVINEDYGYDNAEQTQTRIHADTLVDQVKEIAKQLEDIGAEMGKNVSTSKNHKYIYHNNYKAAHTLINSCTKQLKEALKKLESE